MQDPYLYDGTNTLKNLANITDSAQLKKAEGNITAVNMPLVYTQTFEKFNTATICEIHRIIFAGLYEWAGEFRTIPIAKHEEILGGDTVRYAYPNQIKKELDATYVRNSLVWAAQGIYSKFEYLEAIFYDAAGLAAERGAEKTIACDKDYSKIGDYSVDDYKEAPHIYLNNNCNNFKETVFEGDIWCLK